VLNVLRSLLQAQRSGVRVCDLYNETALRERMTTLFSDAKAQYPNFTGRQAGVKFMSLSRAGRCYICVTQ
jgi:adenylosuccinate synthase